MKVSFNWLKDYLNFDLGPDQLAERLTMLGLEVESVDRLGSDYAGVVVGRVLNVASHPNADRLTVCSVDAGGETQLSIVCGAPNVAEGQDVPVATVGSTLDVIDDDGQGGRLLIKRAKIRGVESDGMICSASELGLSDDHTGIMVLAAATPGEPFADYLTRSGRAAVDHVIDIDITPNRPDAISHIGVARDIAAVIGRTLSLPQVTIPESGGDVEGRVSIEIEDPAANARYVALMIEGTSARPSPAWMQQRLEAVGLRPRNCLVDVTNYVMMECGQPLHAFDFSKIRGGKIITRRTDAEMKFTTLDGKERDLPSGTLMICDGEGEIAIAGIMGGANSEVSQDTTSVLIESAFFDPKTIRRTAKALALQTDASYRFERGVDSAGQPWAAMRAAQLIIECGGGKLVPGIIDNHPVRKDRVDVNVRQSRVNTLVGAQISPSDVSGLLRAIGFDVEKNDDGFSCGVPTFRPDIEREVDVIEEIARLYGYDNIPEPEHMVIPDFAPRTRPADLLRDRAFRVLTGAGYREIYANSLLSLEVATRYDDENVVGPKGASEPVSTLNPLSSELAALRTTLLPGALNVARHNVNHGIDSVRLFEFGHTFRRNEDAQSIVAGYEEHESLLILAGGLAGEPSFDDKPGTLDYHDVKGTVEDLLQTLRIADVRFVPVAGSDIVAYGEEVFLGGHRIGVIGALSHAVAADLDVAVDLFFAELNWSAISGAASDGVVSSHSPVDRFPVVRRDIAVVVDGEQPVGPLLDAVRGAGGRLLLSVNVFDVYEGTGLADTEKSVAFGLRFGTDRTLRDEEVDAGVAGILGALEKTFAARLRD